MTREVETRRTYCEHCRKDVVVTITPGSARGGHANLSDHEELVCLDFGDACDGEACPLTRFRPVVMGVRLARSGLRDRWRTVTAQCEGCGQVSELTVVDREHAYCTICGSTNTWMVLEFDDHGEVVVTGRRTP